jgi:hypothetical protein
VYAPVTAGPAHARRAGLSGVGPAAIPAEAGAVIAFARRRDELSAVASDAIEAVRQLALDDVWSALRFRPA